MYPVIAIVASVLAFLRICRPSIGISFTSHNDVSAVTEFTLLGRIHWPKFNKTNRRWPNLSRHPLNFGLAFYLWPER